PQNEASDTFDPLPCTQLVMTTVDESPGLSQFGTSGRALGLNRFILSPRSESITTNSTYFGGPPRLSTGAAPGTTSAAFVSAAVGQLVLSRSRRVALPASADRSTAEPVPSSLPSAVAPSSAVARTLTVHAPSLRSAVSFALSGTWTYQLMPPSFGSSSDLLAAS